MLTKVGAKLLDFGLAKERGIIRGGEFSFTALTTTKRQRHLQAQLAAECGYVGAQQRIRLQLVAVFEFHQERLKPLAPI